jgi:eukaryotic-like serine/threonine-protein kinase
MSVDFEVLGYLVLGRLAVGGMAEVYQASVTPEAHRHPSDPAQVALKRLHPMRRAEASAVEQFVDEGKLAVRLKHPHLVQTLRCFKAGEDYFIEQELVRGRTLEFMQGAFRKAGSKFPTAAAFAVCRAVLSALDYLHHCKIGPRAAPVIHRDVAPANVLLSVEGEVKLTDFGVAQVDGVTVAEAGALRGTPAYMAPEAVLGSPVDARADLFSVGVILYELITGEPLFAAESDAETLRLIRQAQATDVREFSPHISHLAARLIRKALQANPVHRFQSASAFIKAIDAVVLRERFPAGAVALRPMLSS